jgi:hypothetical protein
VQTRFFIAENWRNGWKEHVVMKNDALDHFEGVVRELSMSDCCDVVVVKILFAVGRPCCFPCVEAMLPVAAESSTLIGLSVPLSANRLSK